MNLYWIETKKFVKNYYKTIVTVSILFGVLFSGFMFFTKSEPEVEEDPVVEGNTEIFEGDSRPAYFRFFIEQPDGTTYTNGATVDELFRLEEMYELASENTEIDLFEIEEEAQERLEEVHGRLDEADEKFTPVSVVIDTSSNIFTAIIATGDNDNNMEVANFYYNYLFNEGFEVLNNKSLYTLDAPQLSEKREEKENNLADDTNQTQKASTIDIITDGIIGIILGFILTIGFLILKELFNKKLNYSFTYNTGNPDYFVLYDPRIKNIEFIQQFIELPYDSNKVLLSQNAENNTLKKLMFDNNDSSIEYKINEYRSLSESPLTNKIDEIIIIVIANETNREWFNEQLNLSKLRRVPVKIIQINE